MISDGTSFPCEFNFTRKFDSDIKPTNGCFEDKFIIFDSLFRHNEKNNKKLFKF